MHINKKSSTTGFPANVEVTSMHCLRSARVRSALVRRDLGVPFAPPAIELDARFPDAAEQEAAAGFLNALRSVAQRTDALLIARREQPAADAPNISGILINRRSKQSRNRNGKAAVSNATLASKVG